MIELFKRQIEHEIHNSIIYQEIAMWLDVKGFSNLSAYYKKWSDEEKSHGMWVQEFLEQLNVYINIGSISIERLNLENDVLKFAEVTLQTEIETTEMLEECLRESYNTSSLSTVFLLNTMLKEQIEETAKANKIKDTVSNIGNNLALLQLFDNTFEG